MAPSAIVAMAKAANANSYVTVAEADAYFADRLNSTAWTGLSGADDKSRALIMATRRLDEEVFAGARTTSDQALKWPRASAYDGDGELLDEDLIPELIQTATCELAIWLLGADRMADTGLEGFEHVQVGSISVKPRHAQRAGDLPEAVLRALRPTLETPSRSSVLMEKG